MVHTQNIETTAATITWSPPVPQAHLPISQFALSLKDMQFGLPQINATVGGSYNSHNFYGLEEYNFYQCDIVSVSSFGGISTTVTINFRTTAAGKFASKPI